MNDERDFPPRIPIIISQKANHPIQLNILKIRDVGQNKQCILDALTIPDDRWDPDKSQTSWSMISLLMEMDLLSHEDTVRLLTCRNVSTSLHIWGGGEIFMDMLLLERQDIEEHKSHLFRMLTACDNRYDPEFSRYTWDTISFMMEYHFMTVLDILTLLVSTNDSVCFAAWSHAGFLACQGYVSNHDLEKNKSWFLGLLADHTDIWEPQYPRDMEEDDLWGALSYMARNNIITRQDFVALFERNRDDLTAILWMCSNPLVRYGLLDPDDLQKTKDSFFRITRRSLEGATVFDMAHPGSYGELPLWRVIRAAIDRGVITQGDSEFFSYLLSCRNNDVSLSVWKDGSDLIRRGLLSREDFISHKDRFNTLLLEMNIWARCSPEENKHLLRFLLDIGLCTPESLQLLAETDHDSLPIAARSVMRDLALDHTIVTLIKELEDPDPDIRTNAARELEHIANGHSCNQVIETIVDRLVGVLRGNIVHARYHAAEVLKNLKSERAVHSLIPALMDENAGVRFQAGYALWAIEKGSAMETRIVAKEIADQAFMELASVCAIDALIIQVLKQDEEKLRETAARVARKNSPAYTVESVIGALNNGDPIVMHDAACVFAGIATDSAFDALFTSLNNENSGVRETAVLALGRFKSERAAASLDVTLKDDDPMVRYYATRALGAINSEHAVASLIFALKDPSPLVRRSAAAALGKTGSDRAVDPLILSMKDQDATVRFFAACALGTIGSDRATESLIPAQQDEKEMVRVAVEDALERIHRRGTGI